MANEVAQPVEGFVDDRDQLVLGPFVEPALVGDAEDRDGDLGREFRVGPRQASPAKSAVRLRGGRSAYPLVVGAIRGTLAAEREKGGAQPVTERELKLIGQFAGRCILAELGEELIILDQHGAHERIL